MTLRNFLFILFFSIQTAFLCAQATQVKDIHPGGGSSNSNPRSLVCYDDLLYFEANDGTFGRELYQSDGTLAGTVLLRDIKPGGGSSVPEYFAVYAGFLYFAANDGTNGNELWQTDGTVAGTIMFKDIKSGGGNSDPAYLKVVNGLLLFSADENANGRELYKSDGSVGGTELVKDINPGTANSAPDEFVRVGNLLFFEATDGTNGRELWKSDGTAAGTVMVKDLSPGGSSSNLMNMTAVGTLLFFTFNDGVNGEEVWVSDGTDAGTVMVKDIRVGGGSNPSGLVDVGGVLFFAADDNVHGKELWKSDGTEMGTEMVKDIRLGAANSNPDFLANLNGILMFAAHDGIVGDELWRSDGTEAGTFLVKDIRAGGSGSNSQIKDIYSAGPKVYFEANETTFGQEPWKSDGTTVGTVNIDNINPPPGGNGSDPDYFTHCGPYIYFAAKDGVTGVELWRADADICASPSFTACPTNTTISTEVGICSADYIFTATASGSPSTTLSYSFSGATTDSGSGTGSGSSFNKGETNITITADNDCEPNASCIFTVTVEDNEQPGISCPSNQMRNTDPGQCNYTAGMAEFDPTSADDNCPMYAVSYQLSGVTMGNGLNSVDGIDFNKGITTVEWRVTDMSENMNTCYFSVEVKDLEIPSISCPANQTRNTDFGQCYYTAGTELNPTTLSDNCPMYSVENDQYPGNSLSGKTFNKGITSIVWKITDMGGNVKQCSLKINVLDNEFPSTSCPSNQMRYTDNGECNYNAVGTEFDPISSNDNCPMAILSNNLDGTSTLAGKEFEKGMTNVIWTITDMNNNVASCSFNVSVVDNEKPMISCPPDISIITTPGQCSLPSGSVSLGVPSVSDNCGVKLPITNNSPGSYPLGATTVKWLVKDTANNKKYCNQQVTVEPGDCGTPIKVYHTDTTTGSAKIKWTSGTPCVTGYQLRLRYEISTGVWSSWDPNWTNKSGPGNQHDFLSLTEGTYYHYQIRSKCGTYNSTVINGWFYTLGAPPLKKANSGITKINGDSFKIMDDYKTEIQSIAEVSLIPNPAKDIVSVQILGFDNRTKELMMYDLMGKLIFKVHLDASENTPELDLKRLNVKSGLHMISVSDGVNQKTIQLVIVQ